MWEDGNKEETESQAWDSLNRDKAGWRSGGDSRKCFVLLPINLGVV